MINTNVKKVKTTDLELKDRLVAVKRVTKVTKGGRHFSFAAIVVETKLGKSSLKRHLPSFKSFFARVARS
jgi:hypothetical protein